VSFTGVIYIFVCVYVCVYTIFVRFHWIWFCHLFFYWFFCSEWIGFLQTGF